MGGGAARLARVGDDRGPVPPHVGHLHRGAGRHPAAVGGQCQQLRELRRRPGQAVRAGRRRRQPDYGRHPAPHRRVQLHSERRPRCPELGPVPRRKGQPRRPVGDQPGEFGAPPRRPRIVPLPDSGSAGHGPGGEGLRRPLTADEVLPLHSRHARWYAGKGAPARHGRPARIRVHRRLAGRCEGEGPPDDGRGAARPRPSGRDVLPHRKHGQRLDPIPHAGHLHRPRVARVSPLGTVVLLRGHETTAGQLLLPRHRGLLHLAMGDGLRKVDQLQP